MQHGYRKSRRSGITYKSITRSSDSESDTVISEGLTHKRQKVTQSERERQEALFNEILEDIELDQSGKRTFVQEVVTEFSHSERTPSFLQSSFVPASVPPSAPLSSSLPPPSSSPAPIVYHSESFDPMRIGTLRPFIGAHVSIAAGFAGAVEEAVKSGASAFSIFTGSQRRWKQKPIEPKFAEDFQAALRHHAYSPHNVIPHASYLINMAASERKILDLGRDLMVKEMHRCHMLGLPYYNIHSGAAVESSKEQAIKISAESINLAHEKTPKEVMLLIENTAGQGSSIGNTFEEIRDIILLVRDKNRVGVCLDTCHMFAAGYDIRTKEGVMSMLQEFDRLIGLKYLKAFHLNDSQKDLNSRMDRHEHIGKGKIGRECFTTLVNDPRLRDIPMVLETEGPFNGEISLLRSLVKK